MLGKTNSVTLCLPSLPWQVRIPELVIMISLLFFGVETLALFSTLICFLSLFVSSLPQSFLPQRWVFGLSRLLPLFPIKKVRCEHFWKKRTKLCFVFRPKTIFFDFRTKYLFDPAGVWKHMTKIKLLVCLFWQSFTITFRLRVFVFFALVAFSSLLKIKGCHVFLGFPPLGVFEFPLSTFLGFPLKGDCIGFLSVNGVGACAAFWGVSPPSFWCFGVFPLSFSFFLFYTAHFTQKYIHTYTLRELHCTLYSKIFTHIHTTWITLTHQISPALFISRKNFLQTTPLGLFLSLGSWLVHPVNWLFSVPVLIISVTSLFLHFPPVFTWLGCLTPPFSVQGGGEPLPTRIIARA